MDKLYNTNNEQYNDADFCKDAYWKNNYSRSRVERYDSFIENENSRQGGYSARPTAINLCRQTAGR